MTESHAPVLIVVDPTATRQPALQRGADLARRTGAPLVLLACIFDPYLTGEQRYGGIDMARLRRTTVDHHLGKLRQLAKPLAAEGLRVTCRAVFDHPLHEGIVREVQKHGAVMVIKDTHHHGALSRLFLTNTDWQLIRECPVALWLVKHGELVTHGAVLAAVDPLHEHDKPAELDHRIIRQAQVIGVLFDDRVHVAHAFNPVWSGPGSALPATSAIPVGMQPEVVAQIRQDHQDALDRLAADVGFPGDQVHLAEGDAAEVLPDLARNLGAAVLIMGAVARSRLKRAFVGSTAERVLEQLPCDVVIVKPEAFQSPVTSRGKALGYLARTANYGKG